MARTEGESDLGVGAAIALGIVAVGAAFVMATNPGSPVAGWGFAVAVVAGAAAVVAAQFDG